MVVLEMVVGNFAVGKVEQIRRLHTVNTVLRGNLHSGKKMEEGFSNNCRARSKQHGCFEKMVGQMKEASEVARATGWRSKSKIEKDGRK